MSFLHVLTGHVLMDYLAISPNPLWLHLIHFHIITISGHKKANGDSKVVLTKMTLNDLRYLEITLDYTFFLSMPLVQAHFRLKIVRK